MGKIKTEFYFKTFFQIKTFLKFFFLFKTVRIEETYTKIKSKNVNSGKKISKILNIKNIFINGINVNS